MRPLHLILLGFLVAAAAFPVMADDQSGKTPGNIPVGVTPTHYDITLNVDPNSSTFHGSTRIDVIIAAPTNQVVLNAKDLKISRAVVAGREEIAATVMLDTPHEIATLTFDQSLTPGPSTFVLDYEGKVNTSSSGLFVTDYETSHAQRKMLTTQFEPADARSVFPGWDEPSIKATFDLTVTIPSELSAVSNMPEKATKPAGQDTKRVVFETTPKMSTYLLFLGVGDFETISKDAEGTKVSIVAKRGDAEKGRFALEEAVKLLNYYNDYFGIPFPLPKLDFIAVPGSGAFSAMENWGAILHFEPALLLDPASSSEAYRQRVFVTEAHEMAHQWFGDLVTMRWWDDLWLNEGFASWMERKATDTFHPDWGIWLQARAFREPAMRSDALSTSHSIVQPIGTPAEAELAFDEITYQKSQAVIRMLESFLGPDRFREGIRQYMRAHAYGNAITADLWAQLAVASGKPVEAIAASFTTQPGIPLVTAEQAPCQGEKRAIALRQGRFALDMHNPPSLAWKIPIGLRAIDNASPASAEALLDGNLLIGLGACDASGAITANADGIGYYRVSYAAPLFAALADRFARLEPTDQLILQSDAWALGEAGLGPVSAYLDLTRKIPVDADVSVWRQTLDTLLYLDELYQGLPQQAAFRAYAWSLLRPVAARLGWDAKPGEPANDALLRERTLTVLGSMKESTVVAEAQQRFRAFQENPASLAGAIRVTVLRIVGAHADPTTYDALRTIGQRTEAFLQKRQIYDAIAYARDPMLAHRTLELSLTNEVPAQLRPNLVRGVASGGRHPDLAWPFLRANFDAITANLDSLQRYVLPAAVASNFYDARYAADLSDFAEQHIPAEARAETNKAAAVIGLRARTRTERLPEVNRWLGGAVH